MSSKANEVLELLGRILISIIFVKSGIDKIPHIAMVGHIISTKGIPGFLAYGVVALEIGGGLALALGMLTRTIASALAVFSILAISLFLLPNPHKNWTLVLMEWAMVGGLFYCIANGAGRLSLDQAWLRRWWGSGPPLQKTPRAAERN
ncbi:MAG: DoxX family protein [Terriglobia bacterium]